MRKKVCVGWMAISILMLIMGCSDNDQKATLQVMLTDAPADYEQVLIDIQDVQIHVSEDENDGEWLSLQVNKGIYNLLDFRNGMDTLLAFIELPAGTVSQMRLVLGSENQVKVNGEVIDLETPSSQQSGLKLNIHAALTEGITYKLWIDFDAARSIVHRGSGTYSLKPVIRTFTEATSGAISGNVSPAETITYVEAMMEGDTLGTYSKDDGSFLLKAVPQGTWKVLLDPADPYIDTTVEDVNVINGQITLMDTVYFNQM